MKRIKVDAKNHVVGLRCVHPYQKVTRGSGSKIRFWKYPDKKNIGQCTTCLHCYDEKQLIEALRPDGYYNGLRTTK